MTVQAYLAGIRTRSGELAGLIAPLSSEQWSGPTNCPPWAVSDLARHVVTSGQGFVRSIRRGLEGIVEPPPPGETFGGDPAEVAQALGRVTDDFEGLYAGLSEDQLGTVCFHRRGNRSIRWYAAHRLAEVTFHGWDLDVSLGRAATLDGRVARLLLPTLVESNVPRTYAAGLSAERGRGERFVLSAADDPALRWLVTIGPEALEVTRGGGPADLTITADAATLALLVYGRADITRARVRGDPALVERFGKIFPRP